MADDFGFDGFETPAAPHQEEEEEVVVEEDDFFGMLSVWLLQSRGSNI